MEQFYAYSVAIILVILFILFMSGIFWAEFGIPIGIMLALLKAFRTMPYSWKGLIFWSTGGILLIIVSAGLFLLLAYILSIIGFPLHALYNS